MPSRKEAIRKIEKAAKARGMVFAFKRHGGNHDVYDLDGVMIPIERQRQLDDGYAKMVYRQCQVKLGEGWWK